MSKFILSRFQYSVVTLLLGLFVSAGAYAQKSQTPPPSSRNSGTSPADIESLFSDDGSGNDANSANEQLAPEKPSEVPGAAGDNTSATSTGSDSVRRSPRSGGAAPKTTKDISDLGKLEPLKDIAVIQRRYLPKTGRFEFGLGVSTVLNDVFFLNYGLAVRAAYYFQERYGVEFVGFFLSNNPRDVVNDLSNRGVSTKTFVATRNYYGLDFKWSPIYGKMSWRNRKITPFDMYFSAGLGLTGTNQNGTDPTLHLGTGQVFALTKGMAFRWDLSWNFFNATSSVSGSSSSSLYNNLLVTIGMSFFFPEATYR